MVRPPMVRMVARARTTKRRKVGRVKPPARVSKRERAGSGTACTTRCSSRRAARALRFIRRRSLRSRRVAWARRWRWGRRLRREAVRQRWEVATLDMVSSLSGGQAVSYLYFQQGGYHHALKIGTSRTQDNTVSVLAGNGTFFGAP